ncbi:MAG TPA: hypothetical protein VML54_13450, partial [Candidatus Limnocylindrales bacterium]|nr:hypothetical protein [Candidatus Limnocylindrales bacterium]
GAAARRPRRFGLVLAFWLVGAGLLPSVASSQTLSASTPANDPIALLRQGGHVLYIRHAAAEAEPRAERPTGEGCAGQRRLTAQGRTDAAALGAVFKRFGVPLGEILATTYCRAADTARLAFGRFVVARDLFATGVGEDGERVRYAGLRRFLATAPRAGVNNVLVAHAPPFRVATGESLKESEVAIVEPLGPSGFKVVARVPLDAWPRP